MTDTDEDFARWAVAVAYLSDEPERFLPGGGAETVATLLVQAVYEAREAKDAESLLSVMRAVFGERFDRFERKEKFIRRFVAGEAGFPTAEDYDRIARAAKEGLAGDAS